MDKKEEGMMLELLDLMSDMARRLEEKEKPTREKIVWEGRGKPFGIEEIIEEEEEFNEEEIAEEVLEDEYVLQEEDDEDWEDDTDPSLAEMGEHEEFVQDFYLLMEDDDVENTA